MEEALRVRRLPPYLFARIDKMILEAKNEGVDVISFGIGDPDQPTPEHIITRMGEEIKRAENHRYPSYEGLFPFRQQVVEWFQQRFGVGLDPDKEVVSLIGSKEGIGHLPLCLIDPGDLAFVPDPAYPVYQTSVILAGGEVFPLPLKEENNFLVDWGSVPKEMAKKAKLIFLNYPNNPTSASAPLSFFQETVDFAREYQIFIAHDAAYSEIAFDGFKPPSILQAEGAKEVAIEFHSLSKTYNMTGWRIGWAAGSPLLVGSLGKIKSNIDSGIFSAIQYAGIEALQGPESQIKELNALYQKRRDLLCKGLKELGASYLPCQATFFLWVRIPPSYTSEEFSSLVFKETGVFFTPGIGYGANGEGYVRLSLTLPEERIIQALTRLKDTGLSFKGS